MMSDANAPMNMSVAELIERRPESIRVFMQYRMACVGCDIAPFETVAEALAIYGVDREQFAQDLERTIQKDAAEGPTPPREESE